MSGIQSKLQELHNVSQRVVITIGSIEDCLNKEELQDMQFRAKHTAFDNTASIIPSKVLQKDLRENLSKFKDVYDQARATDMIVLREILGTEASEVRH